MQNGQHGFGPASYQNAGGRTFFCTKMQSIYPCVGRNLRVFFSIKVKRGCAVHWPRVGDTMAALRLGGVDGEDLMRRNTSAQPYNRLFKAPEKVYQPPERVYAESENGAKVEAVLQKIEAARCDITGSYNRWINFGFSLASEFGESGRDCFHRISQFHPAYDTRQADEQYTKCLRYRGNRLTLDYFFAHAKTGNFSYKEHFAPTYKEQSRPVTSTLPPGWHSEKFTCADGSQVETMLNEFGYPALWDLEAGKHTALSNAIANNRSVTELIARFDLRLSTVSKLH